MAILISATGGDIESNIDLTFHWSHCFLIVDKLNNSLKPIENRIKNHPNEVKDVLDNLVKKEGVEIVITHEIGQRSFEEFKDAPPRVKAEIIKSYKTLELGSVTLKK